MKRRAIVLSRLTLVAMVGCTPPDPVVGSADDVAIRELIAQAAALNNTADTIGWVELFEPGAVYMPPGMPAVSTRGELVEVAAAGFGPYAAAIIIDPAEIVVSGDWAYARSEVRGMVSPRTGGDPIAVNVKQLAVYHKQPSGEWKIARLMNNSNR